MAIAALELEEAQIKRDYSLPVDLLSQTPTAHDMGQERFRKAIVMAQQPHVQDRFNEWFPNIANNPTAQKDYERMREELFGPDEIDCYALLREAYTTPRPVETPSNEPSQTTVYDARHPIREPSTFIG